MRHKELLSNTVVTFSEAESSKFFYSSMVNGKRLTVVVIVSELYEINFKSQEKISCLLENYECEVYLDGKIL